MNSISCPTKLSKLLSAIFSFACGLSLLGGGKRRTLGTTEHVGVGVGVGSGSLEKCGIDPNDVYELSFYIFILGVIRKFKEN